MQVSWKTLLGVGGLVLLLVASELWAVGVATWLWAGVGAAGLAILVWYVVAAQEELRRLLTSRTLRHGTNAVVLSVVVVGIVVLVNVIAGQRHVRWDLTANQIYSLSPQTREVLQGLDGEVAAYAFIQEGSGRGERIRDLLQEYAYVTPNFTFVASDPNRNPALANEYQVRLMNTVVFEYGSERRMVYEYNVFTQSDPNAPLQFEGEQAFTRAILQATSGPSGSVYFLTGHGERNYNLEYRSIREYLQGEGFTVDELNLAQSGNIPDDAATVILPGPQRDYSPEEIEVLDRYLRDGGRLYVMLDPPRQGVPTPRLVDWLATLGVEARRDLVIDPEQYYFVDPLSPIPNLEFHAVTRDLMMERLALVVPQTRSLAALDELPDGVTVDVLLETSDAAWGETTLDQERASKDDADTPGPLALAVAVTVGSAEADDVAAPDADPVEAETTQPIGRMLVMGSGAFATNEVLNFQGNLDFFLNGVNWLAGREDQITIRPKSADFRPVLLTAQDRTFVFYTSVLFLPLAVLLTGGVTWWRRRNL